MVRKKTSLFLMMTIILLMGCILIGCGSENSIKGTYQLVVEGYEWGPSITKAIIKFTEPIDASQFSNESFIVKAGETKRKIIAVANSDDSGNKVDGVSNNVVIEMEIGYEDGGYAGLCIDNSSAFYYNTSTGFNIWAKTIYTIELAENEVVTLGDKEYKLLSLGEEQYNGQIIPNVDNLEKDVYVGESYEISYISFQPDGVKEDNGGNPLIIWLNGGGEGGTDPVIAILGNEVTNLYENSIQQYFSTDEISGAYVLALQCPGTWMQGYVNGADSVYTKDLMAAIENYVNANPDIDTTRIYIGGCSNGGYMSLNLMFRYTDYFAAAFPICTGYQSIDVTDEMIDRIKDKPIWFTHAADDTTLYPTATTIPIYARLIRAGAENVYFTYTENVTGTESEVKYLGHWSWIITLQNRCELTQDAKSIREATDLDSAIAIISAPSIYPVSIDGANISIFEWISKQHL